MKKILSLGIASAVLAMTAISASAALVVRCDDVITPGATVKVDFVLDADASDVSFTVVASGLELVDASMPNANAYLDVMLDNKMGVVRMSGSKANDIVFTQTYKVTAKEGEAVSVSVVADPDAITAMTAAPLTVTVRPATTSDPGTTSSDPGTTSSDPGTTSSDPGTTSGTTSSTPSTTDPTNPNTGIALAIFPAVIAGAAVVVAKKKRG